MVENKMKGGLYRSDDGGKKWAKIKDKEHSYPAVSLISPSGAANRSIGADPEYKKFKVKDPDYATFKFRIDQYSIFL